MTRVDGFDEPSHDELLTLLEREWADWEALIARTEAVGRLEQPGASGAWSMKDVVAHVTGYQRFGASLIGGDVRRVEVPPGIGLDTQRRNEWFHEQDRARSSADVLAEARQVHAEIVRRVLAMSPEELRRHPVEWQPWPAWRWIVHLTHEHYPEHVPNVEAWLDRS